MYVEGGPVNIADPSGLAYWIRSADSIDLFSNPRNTLHIQVQLRAMIENWDKIHAEYPIPVGQIRQLALNGVNLSNEMLQALDVLERATHLTYVDLLNEDSGELWEIKPKSEEEAGLSEVRARLAVMLAVQQLGFLRGNDHPIRGNYNWTTAPQWILGLSLWQIPVYLGNDPSGWWTFYARQSQQGVVIWWKVMNRTRQPSDYPLPVPEDMRWTERNTEETHPRTVYVPGRGFVPNPALGTSTFGAICVASCHVPGYEAAPVSEALTEASINVAQSIYAALAICAGAYFLGPAGALLPIPIGAR